MKLKPIHIHEEENKQVAKEPYRHAFVEHGMGLELLVDDGGNYSDKEEEATV